MSIVRRLSTASLLLTFFLLAAFSVTVSAQEDDDQPDPIQIFNQGQEAHEKGDLQQAIKLYEEAIRILPEFPEAEYQRAAAYLALNRPEEAEKGFRRAIEIREDWTLPMAALGSLLIRRNNFAEAEKFLTRAVELDERNSPAIVALTELRLKTKASESVLRELLAKLKSLSEKANPTASVWAARGALERALGEKAAAKASLARALSMEPTNSLAIFEQVELSLSENDLTRAEAEAETLFKAEPNSRSARLLLARVYAAKGKTDEALKILDAMDGGDTEVATLKNSITARNSNDVGALEKQLEKDPGNADLLGQLCSLTRTSNPQKSLEYCRRAAEADPTDINHAVGYGAALVQAKQFEAAVTLFRRILTVSPDNFTVRANLATALFQLKRYQEAKAEYRWLTEKKPDLAVAYYFLAIAHDSLAEYLDAMANYQQFLRLADPQINQLEIEKVNLRLPALQKLIKDKSKKK